MGFNYIIMMTCYIFFIYFILFVLISCLAAQAESNHSSTRHSRKKIFVFCRSFSSFYKCQLYEYLVCNTIFEKDQISYSCIFFVVSFLMIFLYVLKKLKQNLLLSPHPKIHPHPHDPEMFSFSKENFSREVLKEKEN